MFPDYHPQPRSLRQLTLTLASVRFVHMAISSRVDMSGYRFRLKVCSSSCSCCDVKWVRWRRCRLFFLSFLVAGPPELPSPVPLSAIVVPPPSSWDIPLLMFSVFTEEASTRVTEGREKSIKTLSINSFRGNR